MIKNAKVKWDIATSGVVVRKLSTSVYMSRGTSGGWMNFTRPDDSYSLPFLLAVSALDQVLSELIAQGEFSCKSWMLGTKMTASRIHLPWQDYSIVDQAKDARNCLAHEGMLLCKADCIKYINAIEHELKSWCII